MTGNGLYWVNDVMKNLNKSYFEVDRKSDCEYDSFAAMSYMLYEDYWTELYTGFKDGNEQINYVIGGPTVEQLFTSYNKKYQTQYSAKADGFGCGYKIAKTPTSQYCDELTGLFNESDNTYVCDPGTGTKLYYLSSPSGLSGVYSLLAGTRCPLDRLSKLLRV